MNLQKNVLLSKHSNYKIGGPAKLFAEVFSNAELKEAIVLAKSLVKDKIFVLGKGTNILIKDEGYDGLVILNNIKGIKREGYNLKVGSGVLIKDILDYCIENTLSGLEWAGGLPGTIGAAVRGNSGAFGKEIKDNILQVESLNTETMERKTRNNDKCEFSYRASVFKSEGDNQEIITSVTLRLEKGNKREIKEKIKQKIDYRKFHQPLCYPSLGSTFKNIPFDSLPEKLQKEFKEFVKTDPFPVVPVTKILALCGLKGKRIGGAVFSEKHTNFISNIDNATAKDVKTLIEIAKKAVKQKYGIDIKEEIIYLN